MSIMTLALVGDEYSRVVENAHNPFSDAWPYSVRVCGGCLVELLHDFTTRAAQIHLKPKTVS